MNNENYITPMQVLKNQFDDFKTTLCQCGFKEVVLNKSNPKTHVTYFCGEREVFEKKGVSSDFIKLFKIKFNKEKSYSIGFSFNYLNLRIEDQTIKVSLKTGEDIFLKSKEFSIVEFQEIFKNLLKNYKNQTNLNHEKIIQSITKDFCLLLEQPKYQGKNKKIKI